MPGRAKINSLNQRLAGLAIKLAAPRQNAALQCALDLHVILESPREIFAWLCPDLCPSCNQTCCRRVTHRGVIDTADLVFWAALGISELPQMVREDNLCPWLGDKGCAMPWNARPFACLHYICAPLQNAMSQEELEQVRTALAQAGDARSRLLMLFLKP